MSRKWLDGRFKELVEQMPSDEIRTCKLKHVAGLLIDTDVSLKQILARGRFSSAQNLVRRFKAQYGISPHAYRLKSRGVVRGVSIAGRG